MVKWSLPAKTDLKQIHDYIAMDSRYYAKKVAQTIVEKTEDLPSFPERGRIVSEIGVAISDGVRSCFLTKEKQRVRGSCGTGKSTWLQQVLPDASICTKLIRPGSCQEHDRSLQVPEDHRIRGRASQDHLGQDPEERTPGASLRIHRSARSSGVSKGEEAQRPTGLPFA
jgi:plasmid stabilization system protein ParE